jgi:hypothetical protein
VYDCWGPGSKRQLAVRRFVCTFVELSFSHFRFSTNREFRRKVFDETFSAWRMTFWNMYIYIYVYIYICMYTHVSSLVCMRVSWCLGFSRFLRVQINGHVMWIYPPYLGPATQKGLPVVLRMTLCSHTPNRLDVNDVDPRESQTDEMRWICFSRLNWDTRLSNSFTMWVQPRTQTTGLPSSFATCSKKSKFDAKQLDHGVFNTTEINNRAMVAVSVDSCLVKIWPVGGILQWDVAVSMFDPLWYVDWTSWNEGLQGTPGVEMHCFDTCCTFRSCVKLDL